MASTYRTVTSETDKFAESVNQHLTVPDTFWVKDNKYVSSSSINDDSKNIMLVMTIEQWYELVAGIHSAPRMAPK
jgi:hypothetical protein